MCLRRNKLSSSRNSLRFLKIERVLRLREKRKRKASLRMLKLVVRTTKSNLRLSSSETEIVIGTRLKLERRKRL